MLSIAFELSVSIKVKYNPFLSSLCHTLPTMIAIPSENTFCNFHSLCSFSVIGLSCQSDHFSYVTFFLVSAGITLTPIIYRQKSAQSLKFLGGNRFKGFVIF